MSLETALEWTLGSWTFLGVVIPLFIFLGLGAMGLTPPEFTFAKVCFSLAVTVAMLSFARWLASVTNESLPLLGRVLCGFLLFGLLGASWVEVTRWVREREKMAIIASAHAEPQDQPESATPLVAPTPTPATSETAQRPQQTTPKAEQKLTQQQDQHPTGTNKGDTAVPKRKDKQPSINQNMTNSPGGMQAGRDLIVNPPAKPWGLSLEHLTRLAQREAPYARPEKKWGDLITCPLGDPDSTQFAVNLVTSFRTAGWNLPDSGFSQSIFSGNPVGVFVKVHSQDSHPLGMSEFIITLREAGIEPQGMVEESVPADEFQIVIGHKP